MQRLIDIIPKAPKSFDASIKIATLDGDVSIGFKCKYRTKTELSEWIASVQQRSISQAAVLMEAAEGWGLEEQFTEPNVEQLLDVFHCYADFMDAYYGGLFGQRAKN